MPHDGQAPEGRKRTRAPGPDADPSHAHRPKRRLDQTAHIEGLLRRWVAGSYPGLGERAARLAAGPGASSRRDVWPPLAELAEKWRASTEAADLPSGPAADDRQKRLLELALRRLLNEAVRASPGAPFLATAYLDVALLIAESGRAAYDLPLALAAELMAMLSLSAAERTFGWLEARQDAFDFRQKNIKPEPTILILLRMINDLIRRPAGPDFSVRIRLLASRFLPLHERSGTNHHGAYFRGDTPVPGPAERPERPTPSYKGPAEWDPVGGPNEGGRGSVAGRGSGSSPAAPFVSADQAFAAFCSVQAAFSQSLRQLTASGILSELMNIRTILGFFHYQTTTNDESAIRRPARVHSVADFITAARRLISEDPSRDGQMPGSPDPEPRASRLASEAERASGILPSWHLAPRFILLPHLFPLQASNADFRLQFFIQALVFLDSVLALCPAARSAGPEAEGTSADGPAPVKAPSHINRAMVVRLSLTSEHADLAAELTSRIHAILETDEGPAMPNLGTLLEHLTFNEQHWIQWKNNNCPPVELPATPAVAFALGQEVLRQPVPPPGTTRDAGDLEAELAETDPTYRLNARAVDLGSEHLNTLWGTTRDPLAALRDTSFHVPGLEDLLNEQNADARTIVQTELSTWRTMRQLLQSRQAMVNNYWRDLWSYEGRRSKQILAQLKKDDVPPGDQTQFEAALGRAANRAVCPSYAVPIGGAFFPNLQTPRRAQRDPVTTPAPDA
ncbi:hypothetical protein H696_02823 [Fonticula alba]|uniref:Uncharacterized protein n=1 Tax=Fonticula alba TaxID=691883 RepID=A0A058Z8T6_FONAL|nr:hypothetical protein H696_02823 [Fonticula alba]KCV70481.1 hypothetical protein H696_02823 [Fonticula alba]|eukprot:XP_009494997.1 hypothetical protein H696_02823 [Fonticula alba]